jgi:hypothetical protein
MLYDKQMTRKTEVISLRIPSEEVEMIKKLATNRKISFNVLINHILDEYFDFNMYAKSVGYMTLPRKTVVTLLELVDEKDVAKAGIPTQLVLVELVYLMKGKFTLQSFLNTFFAWLRDSRFAYSDHFEDGRRTISVNHNMGKKWSEVLKETTAAILEELQVPASFEVLPNTLVFSIRQEDEV